MHKIISMALMVAITASFFSCSKKNSNPNGTSIIASNNNVTTTAAPTIPVGSVPKKFTKKAIIEEFTGEWCGACPGGAAKMEEIISANPDKVYGIAFHEANGGTDPYQTPFTNTYQSYLVAGASVSSFGFPCAAISRRLSTQAGYENSCIMGNSGGSWSTQASEELAETATCGIGLVTKVSGDMLNIDAYVGYNAAVTGSTKLTIVLIEDNLPVGPGGQAGGGGGYMHQHVLRDVITAAKGDEIGLGNTEKYTLVKYKNVNIAGKYKNKENLKVIAYVNIDASEAKNYAVLNAQQASLNETKQFD